MGVQNYALPTFHTRCFNVCVCVCGYSMDGCVESCNAHQPQTGINGFMMIFLQPRFVVNRVTAGDYDCPRKVLSFLTDLHASFRMLNLRNDFLRKKFDGEFYLLRLLNMTQRQRAAVSYSTLIFALCNLDSSLLITLQG